MNIVTISGVVASEGNLCQTDDGKTILNFYVLVDGRKGHDPRVSCAYFPEGDHDLRRLDAGTRVVVHGTLRNRRDRGFFISAREVVRIETPSQNSEPSHVVGVKLEPEAAKP